ncbi:hypothetical protein GGR26_000056 [Lewinella marina]|uniref:hypothetical protein n=1 Tax=Neolewinella marina TaxID=438751 RepID=UPI00117BB87F|nr:hypothetical protein [Neolewinella marina]NJB84311.1 hypothetical protein [Neolewinella marina]
MKHRVQILSIDLIDEYEGTVQFEINGNDYKAFFYGEEYKPGQNAEVELDHLESPLEWDVIFTENKESELRITKTQNSEWSYYGYGKIKSIEPLVADFGDIQLELGNWTNDPKVIGEYIYWAIDRLDISKIKK